MESLGFSDASSVWIDRRSTVRPRPSSPALPGDPFVGWHAEDVEKGLERSNIRWALMVFLGVVLGALGYLGYWLYQRPELQASAAIAELDVRAEALTSHVEDVLTFNQSLTQPDPVGSESDLADVEVAARELFEASAALPVVETERRRLATTAAGVTLDAIDMARDALAYRLAVSPVLVPPHLETNPELIALDEAARAFGDWQLRFDQVRTALPEGVLPDVTDRMDMLSIDLADTLTGYVDALRADDMAAAQAIVGQLSAGLTEIAEVLSREADFAQEEVESKMTEALNALQELDG